MSDERQRRDDFWDLDKLLPKKQSRLSPFASQVSLHEYSDGAPSEGGDDPDGQLTIPTREGACTTETYVPKRQPLITSVTIRRYEGRYDFYDRFRKAAQLYYDVRGAECPFVPFYSYMPQYEQMTREQKDYYFYWRDEVRHGRYPRTDYSYVYLYVYELLNLPEKQTAEQGLSRLVSLWTTYRRDLRALDKLFSVWIQDYCLLYRLTPPVQLLQEHLNELIAATSFKEFYLFDADAMTEEGLGSLLLYFSDYDYHASRYFTGDSKDAFEGHMRGAMGPLIARILREAEWMRSPRAVIVRDAFPNSLCTHKVKCRLEIEYHPVARATQLRDVVTGAVKYTENRLRALLGVKSRLAVKHLPDEYKRCIDRYFDTVYEDVQRTARREQTAAYEHKYDAPQEALSFSGAIDIEKQSWSNTLRLVSEEEALELSGASQAEEASATSAPDTVAETACDSSYGLSGAHIDLLRRALVGDVETSVSADVLAEEINEAFSEQLGDVVLTVSEQGYRLIEDYREDVEAWLSNMGT